ncbi:hypothetical protein HanXRQr2_Chr08g0354431 [Helianthus annuus]|uniref:Uncharacterized protein n=1 Tax=Helianthus annuus TaxID=4232 RepID=A0A251SV41_HELAN|nr:hypothetical protein HanXRQr2_Chr08g0354431 [Helianthus annuus]KAJ0902865.1 hypothetical protein HanPSC8_Chr08g0342251 [Helianthus annuus]
MHAYNNKLSKYQKHFFFQFVSSEVRVAAKFDYYLHGYSFFFKIQSLKLICRIVRTRFV